MTETKRTGMTDHLAVPVSAADHALGERTVYPTVPAAVEYCLTPLGTTLIHSVNALVRWTAEHEREIAAARSIYDARLAEPIRLQSLERAARLSG